MWTANRAKGEPKIKYIKKHNMVFRPDTVSIRDQPLSMKKIKNPRENSVQLSQIADG